MLEREKALKLAKKLSKKVSRLENRSYYRDTVLNCLNDLVVRFDIQRSEL
jgi:hypothetical protein